MGNGDEAVAKRVIDTLGLTPHPEGGWYRETWRAAAMDGDRAAGTAIYFLLEAHQRSHWHRVDGDEHWFWHAGAPLRLSIGRADGQIETAPLGADIAAAERPQALVPAGSWQAAEPLGGWTLVSCTVIPGFEFAGFTLAPEGWSPSG